MRGGCSCCTTYRGVVNSLQRPHPHPPDPPKPYILNPEPSQVGVLVNDLATVNIDGALLSELPGSGTAVEPPGSGTAVEPLLLPGAGEAVAPLGQQQQQQLCPPVLELSGGCVCCNLKGDMLLVGLRGGEGSGAQRECVCCNLKGDMLLVGRVGRGGTGGRGGFWS